MYKAHHYKSLNAPLHAMHNSPTLIFSTSHGQPEKKGLVQVYLKSMCISLTKFNNDKKDILAETYI